MADETIRIDTRIDTDSAERDLDELKRKLKDTSAEGKKGFNEAGKALDTADKSTKGLTVSMSSLKKALTGLSISTVAYKVAQGVKDIYVTTEEAYASIRKASTMFGDVAVDQENLVNKLSKIAADTGSEISTLGEAVYQAMSAGIAPTEDMSDVLSAVEKSAKLASGGFTDTETAMSASLSVLNAYKMDIKDLDKIQGILLQTQNKGVTTVGQLGSALSKVTPTASAFGVSFEQVASAIALMTKQGTSTEIATTALSTILSELGKSGTTASENLEKAAQSAGKTTTSFSGLLKEGMNISEILSLMSDYATKNGLSMVDMFGSIEAGRAALQLAGENTSDFNEILASMGDTAGLVSEAFEKTVTPADRLASSFNNLVVTVGTKMKPVWDDLLGSMADMLTKLTNQQTAGDKMKTSFDTLKTALEEYKKAEEQARIETDMLNNSILSIAKTNLNRALNDASSAYSKNMNAVEEYDASLKKIEESMATAKDRMDQIAKATGNTTEQLQRMSEEDRKLEFVGVENGIYMYDTFMAQWDQYIAKSNKFIETEGKKNDAIQAETDLVETLAMLYAEDAESAEFLLTAYPKLTEKVKERSKAYVEQGKALETIVNAGQQLAENDPAETVVSGNLDLQASLDKVMNKYEKLTKASDVLGDSYYSQEQYLKDLESLYAGALVEGIDASSDAMKNLADEIERIKGIIEKADDATVDWKGTWDDFRKQGYASLLKDISSAFDEIFQKESNLIKLEEELSDLSKEEYDNKEAIKTAQSDLDDAIARGNQSAIDNANEKLRKAKETLKTTQSTIEAVNKEKKAVEDGSSVWKAFGNSAMQSMASVLESLGSSLAAQAAAALIGMNWGGAALATAGSLAAYAAASWARSQKFASGGIVGGTSYSGDNVLARVNSGELILNMAQQDNVAKALSTLADMSGLGTSGGAGVNVYLSGASFYGLDEPAVGKAIYDNIQQLHYEGVI